MSEIQADVTENGDQFGLLLQTLERKNLISWSTRGRLAGSSDVKELFKILEGAKLLSWSDAVGVTKYESLLEVLMRRGVISWSDKSRLAITPGGGGGRRR